jgi:predicted nucleotidyltransferase
MNQNIPLPAKTDPKWGDQDRPEKVAAIFTTLRLTTGLDFSNTDWVDVGGKFAMMENCLNSNHEINDMLSDQSIMGAARRAAAAASVPAQVMVFGSYARGDADEGSDLDLVVIEREVTDKTAEYLKLHRAIGLIGVGVDVLVFSVDEFARRSQVPGTVAYWAKKEGKLLYDAQS